MGASQVCSVILRVLELVSAAIVAGIIGRYLHYLAIASASADSRTIYTEVIAGISLIFSIAFMPPLKYSFYGFTVDFILFICWMVAFGLLENLTAVQDCSSFWYWSSWGYYWGGYWYYVPPSAVTQSLVGTVACSKWHTVLAFSFIGSWCWLISGFIGIYVCSKNPEHETTSVSRWHWKAGRKTEATAADAPAESNVLA